MGVGRAIGRLLSCAALVMGATGCLADPPVRPDAEQESIEEMEVAEECNSFMEAVTLAGESLGASWATEDLQELAALMSEATDKMPLEVRREWGQLAEAYTQFTQARARLPESEGATALAQEVARASAAVAGAATTVSLKLAEVCRARQVAP